MAKSVVKGEGFIIEDNIIKAAEDKSFSTIDRNIGKIIFDTLSSHPKHVGQIEAETGKESTFEVMKDRSIRLAIWLKKQGIVKGDVVANCLPIHPEVYSIIFSSMFIGATYCAWDIEMNLELASYYLDLIQPKVLFACKNKVDMLQEAARTGNNSVKIVVFDTPVPGLDYLEDILATPSAKEVEDYVLTERADPQSACLIAFSSGTTGLPKASLHPYEKAYTNAIVRGLKENTRGTNEVALMYFYPSWAVHYWCLLSFVINRATQIIHDNFTNVAEVCNVIDKYQVTYLYLHTHTLVSISLDCPKSKFNLDSLKQITPVGSKLNVKAFGRVREAIPKAFVEVMLAMTETNVITRHTAKYNNPASAGAVVPGVQLKIIDRQTGKALGPNEKGEICVKTTTFMTGYYKSPTNALGFDEEGWLHTADEAYYNEKGEVIIVGRFKDVINYQIYHVSPSCVEDLLRTLPDVVEAAVVPIPHDVDGERAVAFIKTVPNPKVTKEEINQLVAQLEIPDLLNDRIYFIEKMPYNNNGKLKRRELAEKAVKYQNSESS